MATIKSFTDIEQSKVLANIFPLESADMYYFDDNEEPNFKVRNGITYYHDSEDFLCCWSLSALLGVLPNGIVMNKDSQNGRYHFSSKYIGTYVTADNPIDACYEVIIKLHGLNLL